LSIILPWQQSVLPVVRNDMDVNKHETIQHYT